MTFQKSLTIPSSSLPAAISQCSESVSLSLSMKHQLLPGYIRPSSYPLFSTCCAWLLSPVLPFVTPLSMGILQAKYWSGLPCPSPGDLLSPGIESRSPALQVDSLPSEPPGKLVVKSYCSTLQGEDSMLDLNQSTYTLIFLQASPS